MSVPPEHLPRPGPITPLFPGDVTTPPYYNPIIEPRFLDPNFDWSTVVPAAAPPPSAAPPEPPPDGGQPPRDLPDELPGSPDRPPPPTFSPEIVPGDPHPSGPIPPWDPTEEPSFPPRIGPPDSNPFIPELPGDVFFPIGRRGWTSAFVARDEPLPTVEELMGQRARRTLPRPRGRNPLDTRDRTERERRMRTRTRPVTPSDLLNREFPLPEPDMNPLPPLPRPPVIVATPPAPGEPDLPPEIAPVPQPDIPAPVPTFPDELPQETAPGIPSPGPLPRPSVPPRPRVPRRQRAPAIRVAQGIGIASILRGILRPNSERDYLLEFFTPPRDVPPPVVADPQTPLQPQPQPQPTPQTPVAPVPTLPEPFLPPGLEPLTPMQPAALGFAQPATTRECECEEETEEEKEANRRPSNVVARVRTFERRMSENSLDNLR